MLYTLTITVTVKPTETIITINHNIMINYNNTSLSQWNLAKPAKVTRISKVGGIQGVGV